MGLRVRKVGSTGGSGAGMTDNEAFARLVMRAFNKSEEGDINTGVKLFRKAIRTKPDEHLVNHYLGML